MVSRSSYIFIISAINLNLKFIKIKDYRINSSRFKDWIENKCFVLILKKKKKKRLLILFFLIYETNQTITLWSKQQCKQSIDVFLYLKILHSYLLNLFYFDLIYLNFSYEKQINQKISWSLKLCILAIKRMDSDMNRLKTYLTVLNNFFN